MVVTRPAVCTCRKPFQFGFSKTQNVDQSVNCNTNIPGPSASLHPSDVVHSKVR